MQVTPPSSNFIPGLIRGEIVFFFWGGDRRKEFCTMFIKHLKLDKKKWRSLGEVN